MMTASESVSDVVDTKVNEAEERCSKAEDGKASVEDVVKNEVNSCNVESNSSSIPTNVSSLADCPSSNTEVSNVDESNGPLTVVKDGHGTNMVKSKSSYSVEHSSKKTLSVNGSKSSKEIREISVGDPSVKRCHVKFEVVTARVVEQEGKKFVTYTILMKRAEGADVRAAVLERRYNDFSFVYECVLRQFHPSILGDFVFPKKVLLGNFKAEVIAERTEAFHNFLAIIANCDNLLYSKPFMVFLCSREHNEAISHIKMAKYIEAVPLLESLFHVKEKLLTIANVQVYNLLCELVAILQAIHRSESAFAYAKVANRSFKLVYQNGVDDNACTDQVLATRVAFLQLAIGIAGQMQQDHRPFERELSELRYRGARIESVRPLLEIVREAYIHQTSHTMKLD